MALPELGFQAGLMKPRMEPAGSIIAVQTAHIPGTSLV